MSESPEEQHSADFKAFRRYYLEAVEEFGLGDYDHYVRDGDIASDEPGVIASVYADASTCSATVCFIDLPPDSPAKRKARNKIILHVARHEAVHVLLNNFSELASSRGATLAALAAAEERLVVRLCNIGLGGGRE